MGKIFVLFGYVNYGDGSFGSSSNNLGIFSSHEKASNFRDKIDGSKMSYHEYDIVEWEIDKEYF
jgi:hypothetical protein